MKKEFWVEYDLFSENNKKRIIDGFISDDSVPVPWSHITDPAARQHILAQLLSSNDECARKTKCKDYVKGKNGFQKWYYAGDLKNPRGDFQMFLCKRLRWMGDILNLTNSHDTIHFSLPDLSIFPRGSWAIQVNFTLKKPYISKDDMDFYIIDNPVKKEWVFKVPYVAPSQWKGALRSAMRRLRGYTTWEDETDDKQMTRLFGNVKTESEEFSRGYLYFYPTFFDRIGLEVINPHDRKTGVGKQPIYFECVPAGTQGTFTLLYVPMSEIDAKTSKEDLKAVAKGIKIMLTQYGFGAKTSSGYGVAYVNEVKVEPKHIHKVFMESWHGTI